MSAHPELVVLIVLATVLAVLVVSRRTNHPYPVLLVVAGLAVAWLPGMPELTINPQIVLLGVLPPLIFWPAFLSSPRELRASLPPIVSLAFALVFATTACVALFAHLVIGMRWDVAFVLGAVVSATDPVAAVATGRRAGVPRRVLLVLEGEGLINDSAALVAYIVAVEAVTTGRFSVGEAALRFVLGGIGGIAIGLVVGRLLVWALDRLIDPLNAITLVLFGAYFAYLPAEVIGASGVLAAVTAGLYFGWHEPRAKLAPTARIAGFAFWDELVFLLEAFVFFAIGLQMRAVARGVSDFSVGRLVFWTATVVGVTIALRTLWVVFAVWLPEQWFRPGDEKVTLRESMIKAWAGMRGVVSVAAALAIPLTTHAGRPFPDRDLVIFIAYGTVVATLLLQGGTLPAVIRRLRVEAEDPEVEAATARALAAEAALLRAEELAAEGWAPPDCLDEARRAYAQELTRNRARADGGRHEDLERMIEQCTELRRELVDAQRDTLIRLREEGSISEHIHQQLQRELDLVRARLAASA